MWCCAWQSYIFWKNIFTQNIGKMGQKWPEIGFFEFWLENLVINFFWIWSVTKVYIICCIVAKKAYFKKSGSRDMIQNSLSQSSARFLNNFYLWNKSTKKPNFLYINTDSWKLKADWKILGWTWSKTGVATLVSGL